MKKLLKMVKKPIIVGGLCVIGAGTIITTAVTVKAIIEVAATTFVIGSITGLATYVIIKTSDTLKE